MSEFREYRVRVETRNTATIDVIALSPDEAEAAARAYYGDIAGEAHAEGERPVGSRGGWAPVRPVEGVTRCGCGAKYWDYLPADGGRAPHCHSCGEPYTGTARKFTPEPDVEERLSALHDGWVDTPGMETP